ncbi:MAG TPA: DR2241 family protein [Verrucomicrobiae bacterium]|nr:DR2241 family protein [Verrucomicrobiae bacterium]
MHNPAFTEFLAAFDAEIVVGQVLIRRAGRGFELRHAGDRDAADELLELVRVDGLRALAQFTAADMFRPLKSAPNLRGGWRAEAADVGALETALNSLYPGAIADWFAARRNPPPITSYREFTARQTGMYRITTHLDDRIAGAAVRACCHRDFCLKRRLWSVPGLAADGTGEKSIIPCLEPCAVLLEFARKVARLEQEGANLPPVAPVSPDAQVAECDFDSPNNPRRVRFALEKH